jgi:hypothetical protein
MTQFGPMIHQIKRAAIVVQMEDGQTFWIGGVIGDPANSEVEIAMHRKLPEGWGRFAPEPDGFTIKATLREVQGDLHWRAGTPDEGFGVEMKQIGEPQKALPGGESND